MGPAMFKVHHSKHHPNLWYRPYMRNVQIQGFVCPYRQVRVQNSSCILKMGADEWSVHIKVSVKFALYNKVDRSDVNRIPIMEEEMKV